MHSRRLAALLIGAWLAGSLLMLLIAGHNLHAADELLGRSPAPAARLIKTLGYGDARAYLQYQAAEMNRWYFEKWEMAQFGIGACLAAALWVGRLRGWPLKIALMMLAITFVERAWLTPRITALGRQLDFGSADVWSSNRAVFRLYNKIYWALGVLKLGLGLGIAGQLLYRGGNEAPRRKPAAERPAGSQRPI